jgi:hypothetical protein
VGVLFQNSALPSELSLHGVIRLALTVRGRRGLAVGAPQGRFTSLPAIPVWRDTAVTDAGQPSSNHPGSHLWLAALLPAF